MRGLRYESCLTPENPVISLRQVVRAFRALQVCFGSIPGMVALMLVTFAVSAVGSAAVLSISYCAGDSRRGTKRTGGYQMKQFNVRKLVAASVMNAVTSVGASIAAGAAMP